MAFNAIEVVPMYMLKRKNARINLLVCWVSSFCNQNAYPVQNV